MAKVDVHPNESPCNVHPHDATYSRMASDVLTNGEHKPNRTGVDTISLHGYQAKYDLSLGFPALTTKRLNWRMCIAEMLWFMSGECNNLALLEKFGAGNLWRPWSGEGGELGPIYGVQARKWEGFLAYHDQLGSAIDDLTNKPDSRRIIVSHWRPDQTSKMALPPCHVMYQFITYKTSETERRLDMILTQRSLDVPIGAPFNIAQYAALMHMVCAVVPGLTPGVLTHHIGDCHVYIDQVEMLREQLGRWSSGPVPQLVIAPSPEPTIDSFWQNAKRSVELGEQSVGSELTAKDRLKLATSQFNIPGYSPQKSIKFPVAV